MAIIKQNVKLKSLQPGLRFSSSFWVIFSCFFVCLITFDRMPDIIDFTLLDTIYFVFQWIFMTYILRGSSVTTSGIILILLNLIFLGLKSRVRAAISVGIICSTAESKPNWALYPRLCELWSWKQLWLFPALCDPQRVLLLILSGIISTALGCFLIHLWLSVLNLKGTLCRSLEFSLFIALSPPGICPENPTALYSLDSQFHLINTRRLPGSTWTPLLCAMASKLSLYIKLEKSWSSLCSFPITQCHCLSFPEAQYLKNHHFIYFNDF